MPGEQPPESLLVACPRTFYKREGRLQVDVSSFGRVGRLVGHLETARPNCTHRRTGSTLYARTAELQQLLGPLTLVDWQEAERIRDGGRLRARRCAQRGIWLWSRGRDSD